MLKDKLAANDAGFRAFMARISGSFWRFKGLPLSEAEAIMGDNMHPIEKVRLALDHDKHFVSENAHLMRVPYTADELEWATLHGVVLTLFTRSAQHIVRVARRQVTVPEEVRKRCGDMTRAPVRAEWRLVLRPSTREEEGSVLKHQPKGLRKRQFIPGIGLSLSTAFLDQQVSGKLIPKQFGARLTASFTSEPVGAFKRHVLVDCAGGDAVGIRVATCYVGANYPSLIAWKPHQIAR